MSQIGDRRNNDTRRRVEEGEQRRRAALLQDTMSVAVADFGSFSQGELGGRGYMKLSKWHCSETHFYGN